MSSRRKKNILFVIWAVGLAGVIGYLSLPSFFDHIIKMEIGSIIKDSFNGKATYRKITVSSFSDLPYLNISLDSVILHDTTPFKHDTLFLSDRISFSLSLNDWLFDHKYVVKKINFISPRLTVKKYSRNVDNFSFLLLKDPAAIQSDTAKFNFKINYFGIENGNIFYKDFAEKTRAIAENIYLKGTIDINNTANNLKILFSTNNVVVRHKKITYLYKNAVTADLILDYNSTTQALAFNNHAIQIDDFKFGFAGTVRQLNDTLSINVKFNTEESEIKNMMSLIPGIYRKDYDKFEASGTFSLDGEIKGLIHPKYNLVPSYFAHLRVKNGRFKYNHLPNPITDINLDMRYEKQAANPEPIFTLSKFQAKLDSNYISGVATVLGFQKPFIIGNLSTKIELHELSKYLKLDSLEIAGHVVADLMVNGIYDSDSNKFPKMMGKIELSKGYFKRIDVDHAIQNVEMETILTNNTGYIQNTSLKLSKLNVNIDGEYLEMYGKMEDFKKYNFDLFLRSNIDLSKMGKILNVDNQTLTGFVNAKVIAKGSADKFKEAYISGTATLRDIHFVNTDAELDFKVRQGSVVFSPEMILLSQFNAEVFRESFILNGTLRNFIPYFTDHKGILQAVIRINADTLNLNKFFLSVADSKPKERDSLTVGNNTLNPTSFGGLNSIALELKLNVNHLIYDKYTASNLVSNLKADSKSIGIQKTSFRASDASFYIPSATVSPSYFSLIIDITELDTRKLMRLFYDTPKDTISVQSETGATLAINYKLKGDLDAKLKPILNSLNGSGLISVDKANIKGLKIFSHISKASEQTDLHHQEIHDAMIETEVKGGKVFIKPFTVKLGKYITNFEGTHSFNNEINYFIKLGVPPFQKIKIPMHVTGTLDKPEVRISTKKK